MLAPEDLIARYTGGGATLPTGTAMFCGTMPLVVPIGPRGLNSRWILKTRSRPLPTPSVQYTRTSLQRLNQGGGIGDPERTQKFHTVDLSTGWHTPPGIQKGSATDTAGFLMRRTSAVRTRIYALLPAYTPRALCHDYGEEVYLVSGEPDRRQ